LEEVLDGEGGLGVVNNDAEAALREGRREGGREEGQTLADASS
jgi:hypothetical protein